MTNKYKKMNNQMKKNQIDIVKNFGIVLIEVA